ncbi:MAG TPA: plastocyanin/azurin family copper-binding protein [Chloroflexota bacterium]
MRKDLAALVLLTLLLAGVVEGGCTAPATASQAAGDVVRTAQVDLPPSYLFAPAHISVSAGTNVTWTNHDNFSHSVQVDGQSEVHLMRPGEQAQITFASPGVYHYVCTLHTQNMQGTVTVT